MDKVVHLMISRYLRKRIEEVTGTMLDKKHFAYGNIKPDLSRTMFKCPHSLYRSFGVLNGHIQDLSAQQNMADFSEKLGEITHYLSDYFCYAHSDIYSGNGLMHFIYEASMLFTLKRFIRHAKTAKGNIYPADCIQNLKSFVFGEYKRYISSRHTRLEDMIYSFNVSLTFSIKAVMNLSRTGFADGEEHFSEYNNMLAAAK